MVLKGSNGVRQSVLRTRFVGRKVELKEVANLLSSTRSVGGRIAVVSGESGIGKTRLVEEVAARAGRRGIRSLWGRCGDPADATPYSPWLEILGAAATPGGRQLAVEVRRSLSTPQEIRDVAAEIRTAGEAKHGYCRRALLSNDRIGAFECVLECIGQEAKRGPLLVVLEDVHWADASSIALLEFVAARVHALPILIVCTRCDELCRTAGVGQPLWSDGGRTQELRLKGLSEHEVATLIQEHWIKSPSRSWLHKLHGRSEGNPFFISELMRASAEASAYNDGPVHADNLAIPDSVRAIVLRRVSPLSKSALDTLRAAAVLGHEFDVDLVRSVSGATAKRVVRDIDDAIRAGLIENIDREGCRCRFVHALTHQVLYETLSAQRRIALHLRAARALDEQQGAVASVIGRVAHHYSKVAAKAESALSSTIRAAVAATSVMGFEDAINYYKGALIAMSKQQMAADSICDVLCSLGEVQNRAGLWDEGRAAFTQAMEIARKIVDAERFARGALGFKGTLDGTGPPDTAVVSVLDEALARLGGAPSRLRLLVLRALAMSTYFWPDEVKWQHLGEEAFAVAGHLRDVSAYGLALETDLVNRWRPGNARDVCRIASDVASIAAVLGDDDMRFRASIIGYGNLVQLGRFEEAEDRFRDCIKVAGANWNPRYQWQITTIRASVALVHGQVDLARSLGTESFQIGNRVHGETSRQYAELHAFCVACLTGDAEDVVAALSHRMSAGESFPPYRVAVARMLIAVGRVTEASAILEEFCSGGRVRVGDDMLSLMSLAKLCEVAEFTRSRRAAECLYHHLVPFGDEFVVATWGGACDGAVAHHMGLLATVLERWEDAEAFFEKALTMNQRLQSAPFVARSQHYLAAMLLRRNRAGDNERATGLCREAVRSYESIGMGWYLSEVGRLGHEFGDSIGRFSVCSSVRRGAADRASVVFTEARDVSAGGVVREEGATIANVFRREGDYWTLIFEGKVSRFKDKRGLQYLHYLLANPFKQVHSLDLATSVGSKTGRADVAGSVETDSGEGLRRGRLGDVGPALDAKARNDYKRRLAELRQELEQAEAFNDLGRATIVRRELEELTSYLTAASRPGRGARLAGSYSERARVSVRNNIATVVKTIRRADDALGRHLSNAVRTGTFCSYTPERKIRWHF